MTTGKQNTNFLLRHGYVTQTMRRYVALIKSRIRRCVPVTQEQREFVVRIETVLQSKGHQ